MGYSRQQILDKCQMGFVDAATFYKTEIVNYRGTTSDTGELYSEIVTKFVCDNIETIKSSISVVEHQGSYRNENHNKAYGKNIDNCEEKIALELFNQSENGFNYNGIGKIIDYCTSFKSHKDDDDKETCLLVYEGQTLRILNLKKSDSDASMLKCILESYACLRMIDIEKLLKDFQLPVDTVVRSSPLVFKEGKQYKEMQENRYWLKYLLTLLDSKPYYITRKYFIEGESAFD